MTSDRKLAAIKRNEFVEQAAIMARKVLLCAVVMISLLAREAQSQNPSTLNGTPTPFQALPGYQQVFVLGGDGKLWLEEAPFGVKIPPKREQVDGNVWKFQALDTNTVYVLGRDKSLWLEQAPFGTKIPPKRDQVDGSVLSFQALDNKRVYVLGTDGNLWLEESPFGKEIPPKRTQIDANAKDFQALKTGDVVVLGTDGMLWLEQSPFGQVPPRRTKIDGNVEAFQESGNSTSIFVLGENGNLWLEQPPFGKIPPAHREQVDGNVAAFQALPVLNWVWVLGKNGALWLEEGPFDKVPPARQQADANVTAFEASDIQNVLALRQDGNLWIEHAPFGKAPPEREEIDGHLIGSAGVEWSHASLPFDLVYATNGVGSFTDSGLDRNGLMLNPRWFAQVANGPNYRPDFVHTCFVTSSGQPGASGAVVGPNPGTVAGPNGPPELNPLGFSFFDISRCTTQHVSFDPWSGSVINVNVGPVNLGGLVGAGGSVGGLCQGLMSGHLNWFPVTYTGTLYWDDWSNNFAEDDDYNFSLVHQDQSGLTSTDIGSENKAPNPAFLLEFFSDETTHFWGSSFWKQVREDVEQTPRHLIGFWASGNPAIVTGLLGLDGPHSGYTELHPVYSMAVHLLPDPPAKADGKGNYIVKEHWVFWIRDYGNEGNCASMQHLWRRNASDSADSSGRFIYYIQLPWHEQDGVPASSLVPESYEAWAWQAGEAWSVEPDPERHWTYLEFHLANGGYAGFDGEIYLPYVLGRVPANPTVASEEKRSPSTLSQQQAGKETEIDWEEVQKHVTDSQARARLLKAITIHAPIPPAKGEAVTASNAASAHRPAEATNPVVEDTASADPVKQTRATEITAMLPALHLAGAGSGATGSFAGTWELVSSTINGKTEAIKPTRLTIAQNGAIVHLANKNLQVTSDGSVNYKEFYARDAQHGHEVSSEDQADLIDTFTWKVKGSTLVFETVSYYKTAYYGHPPGKEVRTMEYRHLAP